MLLSQLLSEEFVAPQVEAEDKRGLLEEMCRDLAAKVDGIECDVLIESLLEREKLGSTAIGHGVAIPHCKLKGIDRVHVYFARSLRGIDFQTLDDEPVHLFFLIVAPESAVKEHLDVLSAVSRLVRDDSVRERLMAAADGSEICRIIRDEEKRIVRRAV
ncbi:MAG TPA: PTS sugar transporter subunit IIA [Deltaproteobacteria bacterium]|nr:PTS sugar transporter subunit IIA [Deltaproteobacteria bacterium]